MRYFLIEHPTRGVYVEHHHNANNEWKPRFRWTELRSDQGNKRYWSLDQAKAAHDKMGVTGIYILEMERGKDADGKRLDAVKHTKVGDRWVVTRC